MASKCESSGSTLMDMPWNDTQRLSRTPIAAILSSKPAPLSRPLPQGPGASCPPPPPQVKGGGRRINPSSRPRHIAPPVGPPPLQVEHHIRHPLAGAVIGDLPAAPGGKHRKPWLQQV